MAFADSAQGGVLPQKILLLEFSLRDLTTQTGYGPESVTFITVYCTKVRDPVTLNANLEAKYSSNFTPQVKQARNQS